MDGQFIPVKDCETLVGEAVYTTGTHTRNSLAKTRAECAETTMGAVTHAPGARRQWILVSSGAAIPQLLSSIQWTRPTVETIERLRRKTVRIHWGNARGHLCHPTAELTDQATGWCPANC